jgi:hypothetical protein
MKCGTCICTLRTETFSYETLQERPFGGEEEYTGYNIKTNPREIECEVVDRFLLAKDWVQWRAFVNTAMNPRVPSRFF